jgi:serine protease AprX
VEPSSDALNCQVIQTRVHVLGHWIAQAMEGLRGVEYLPEPTDRRIVSAVDPTVVGFQNEWRSEIMGWAPIPVEPVVRARRRTPSVAGIVVFALLVSASLLMWQNQWIVVELPLPQSEWAFEETGIRGLQDDGLNGDGVRVCMVDTGIDVEHEAFTDSRIQFKDMVGGSVSPVDYGAVAHGTLMAGLLLSTDHQSGSAPNVSFAMVAALQDNGEGENTGLDSDVARAIRWCQFDFEADIISLSLGGSQGQGRSVEGDSSSATRQATDAGVYVVAAAGNDGLDDDGDVASPGSVSLAISVGATTKSGELWENSSIGSSTDDRGELRAFPNQKPEVVAPGHRIVSAGDANLWYSSSGTSDSTVFVTGTLALLLEANPLLKPSESGSSDCLVKVKKALAQSLQMEGSSHDLRGGYGMLDAQAWYDNTQAISAC